MSKIRRKISAKEVKASFNYRKGENMPASTIWFGRPLADLITPFIYNIGLTANKVTLLRAVMTVIALLCLTSGAQTALYFSGVFALFAFVLDFVDGHLARLDDNASYWGKYCDGLVDYIFPVMGLFAIGLGLSFQAENAWYVAVGGLISFIALLARTSRDRLRYFQCWMIEKSGSFSEEELKNIQSWQRREYIVSVAAANGRTAALFLLFLPDGGLMFFYSLLLIQGITEPSWLYICLRSGYVSLGRWRKSAHSVS